MLACLHIKYYKLADIYLLRMNIESVTFILNKKDKAQKLCIDYRNFNSA